MYKLKTYLPLEARLKIYNSFIDLLCSLALITAPSYGILLPSPIQKHVKQKKQYYQVLLITGTRIKDGTPPYQQVPSLVSMYTKYQQFIVSS